MVQKYETLCGEVTVPELEALSLQRAVLSAKKVEPVHASFSSHNLPQAVAFGADTTYKSLPGISVFKCCWNFADVAGFMRVMRFPGNVGVFADSDVFRKQAWSFLSNVTALQRLLSWHAA